MARPLPRSFSAPVDFAADPEGSGALFLVHPAGFAIGGYVPDNPFDSIIVGYYQDGKLYCAAKVRNGFVPHTRREVFQQLKRLKTEARPFANLPEKKRTQWALTREEVKNCAWVEPSLLIQIEFGEWTPDGTPGIQSLSVCERTKLGRLYARDKAYPVPQWMD